MRPEEGSFSATGLAIAASLLLFFLWPSLKPHVTSFMAQRRLQREQAMVLEQLKQEQRVREEAQQDRDTDASVCERKEETPKVAIRAAVKSFDSFSLGNHLKRDGNAGEVEADGGRKKEDQDKERVASVASSSHASSSFSSTPPAVSYTFLSDVYPSLQRVLQSPADCSAMLTLVDNILRHPETLRPYRTLRLDNEKFSRSIWRQPTLRALLLSIGFQVVGDKSLEYQDNRQEVVLSDLPPSRMAMLAVISRRLAAKQRERRRQMPSMGYSSSSSSSSSFEPAGSGTVLGSSERDDVSDEGFSVLKRKLHAARSTGVLTLKGVDLVRHRRGQQLLDAAENVTVAEMLSEAMLGSAFSSSLVLKVLDMSDTCIGEALPPTIALCFSQSGPEGSARVDHLEGESPGNPPLALSSPPFAYLRRLNLDGNRLEALPFALGSLLRLERLSCNHNRLGVGRDVAIQALPPSLRQLGLAGNGLHRTPPALACCQELREVSLDLNLLGVLPAPPENYHGKDGLPEAVAPRTAAVDCQSGEEDERKAVDEEEDDSVFGPLMLLPKLERLSLAGNLIRRLPQYPRLKKNACKDVQPSVFPFQSLRRLDVSYNLLRCDDPRAFPSWLLGPRSSPKRKRTEPLSTAMLPPPPPPLEGLALEGNTGVTQAAFLALGDARVGGFLERRRQSKSKGLWMGAGEGLSSFGFCGLDQTHDLRRDVRGPSGEVHDQRTKRYEPGGGRLGGD